MSAEFKFPDVGEGITEGKLVEWKVNKGDNIKVDDIVASVETDKAVVDIPSPIGGTVEDLLFNPGDTLEVGKVIMKIGDGNEAGASEEPKVEEKKGEVKTETTVETAPTVTAPTVENKPGPVSEGQASETETETKSGIPEAAKVEEVPKEETPVKVEVEDTIKDEPSVEAPKPVESVALSSSSDDVLAMPAVRAEAKKRGIDLSSIKGTGAHGQIVMEDLPSTESGTESEGEASETETEAKVESVAEVSESGLKMGELPEAPTEKKKVEIPDHIAENTQEIDMKDIRKEEVQTVTAPTTTESGPEAESEGQASKPEPEEKSGVEESNVEEKKEEDSASPHEIVASPSVKQLARDLGVDIKFVLGSGENGKVVEEDIRRAKENMDKAGGGATASQMQESIEKTTPGVTGESGNKSESESQSTKPKPEAKNVQGPVADVPTASGQDTTVPFDAIRSVISKRMQESLTKSAQVTLSDEANVTKLVELRNKEKAVMEKLGIKLTYLPFFIKAYAECCKEFPSFNAHVNEEGNAIIQKASMDAGIATDTEKGLLVPVIKDVAEKSIVTLAQEITEMSTKAREGKLSASEMSGSSFSISSVGSLAGGVFTPILNYPEVAILGIGRIAKKPVVVNDEISIGDVVTLSLTFDHRAVDGADAAKFMKKLISLLEDPGVLLMEA